MPRNDEQESFSQFIDEQQLKQHPLRDVVVWVLLALVCGVGFYLWL